MISDEVLAILQSADVRQDRVVLTCNELPRDLYEQVNTCLMRIGGKWKGGKTRAHLFPYDPAPLMRALLETRELPPDNPLAYFPTPKVVVDLCLQLLDPWRDDVILEPSAGQGAIADAVRAHCKELRCVELDALNVRVLQDKQHDVWHGSFLDYTPYLLFDRIVMNPPFSVDGDGAAYITHAYHAWSMLRDGGVIVIVAPTSWLWRDDKRSQEFKRFVFTYGNYEIVPRGAFKESGTMVETCVIRLSKDDASWHERPYDGFANWHTWNAAMLIVNDGDQMRELSKQPSRLQAVGKELVKKLNKDEGGTLIEDLINWEEVEEYFAGYQ